MLGHLWRKPVPKPGLSSWAGLGSIKSSHISGTACSISTMPGKALKPPRKAVVSMAHNENAVVAATTYSNDQSIQLGNIVAPKRGDFYPLGLQANWKGGDN